MALCLWSLLSSLQEALLQVVVPTDFQFSDQAKKKGSELLLRKLKPALPVAIVPALVRVFTMVEESPKGMALDDMSTSTPNTKNQHISYEEEEKEYAVKFLFRPPQKSNTNVARAHYEILQVIMEVFPEIKIFNNYGQSKKAFKRLLSYNDYLRHLKLHYSKGNLIKKRFLIYIAIHRICSLIPISEIRRHTDISERLMKINAGMNLHPWSESDLNISNIGFFVGTDPSNVINEEMIKSVQDDIVDQKCTRRYC